VSSSHRGAPSPLENLRVALEEWRDYTNLRRIHQPKFNHGYTAASRRHGFHSTELTRWSSDLAGMSNSEESKRLSWPWWAPWSLLAVVATSLLTVAATLYDIL
jgi:hypothetical protein